LSNPGSTTLLIRVPVRYPLTSVAEPKIFLSAPAPAPRNRKSEFRLRLQHLFDLSTRIKIVGNFLQKKTLLELEEEARANWEERAVCHATQVTNLAGEGVRDPE
jgi:hypothetical protein